MAKDEEIEKCELELSEARSKVDSLEIGSETIKEQFTQEINLLRSQLSAKDDKIYEAAEKLAEQEQTSENLRIEVDEMKRQYKDTLKYQEDHNLRLNQQLAEEKRQSGQKDEFFKQKIVEMENKVKDFIQQDHASNSAKMKSLAEAHQQEVARLQTQIESLQTTINKQRAENSQIV